MADDIFDAMRIKLMEHYKDLDMTTIGVTSGMADCVRLMGFDFQIRGPLPKEQIREIIVDGVEEFLKAINSNEKIRSSLKNYPFTSNGIRISLIINDKNNNDIFYPEISSAFISRGNIYYFYADKEDIYSFKSEEEENYETAKKIVYESRNK